MLSRPVAAICTWLAACLALGLVWNVSGCSAGPPVTSPPQPPASSTVLPTDVSTTSSGTPAPVGRPGAAALDRAQVGAAYRRFWVVSLSTSTRPPTQWRAALAAVATEPLLSSLLQGLARQRARGRADYGSVIVRPKVVALEGDRASIVDCQDATRSGERDLDSGLPLTVGSARTPVAAVMRWMPGRGWRVSDARYVEGSC